MSYVYSVCYTPKGTPLEDRHVCRDYTEDISSLVKAVKIAKNMVKKGCYNVFVDKHWVTEDGDTEFVDYWVFGKQV